MIAALALVTLLGGLDPCAPVEAAAERDPVAAATYLEVAQAERAAGRQDPAIVALRVAASLDPERAEIREGLAQMCATHARERELAAAVEHVRQGRHREALVVLERLAAESPSPDISLLAGASYVHLGEYAKARPHLELAGRNPELAHSASVFLGIAAMREGEVAAAREYFRAATGTRDERLGNAAAELLRVSSRASRLTLLARLGAGYSSNVTLAPDQAAAGEAVPDGSSSGAAAVLYRPLGRWGPWARLMGVYQRQMQVQLRDFDFGQAGAGAGWTIGNERSSA
ncbi:MAG TPA: tetratricopeptide repeat protein, partial [Myxococcaceae bacterium]|nr:tetratricopeptide repeat protein [Myxococcaceae bacterium]